MFNIIKLNAKDNIAVAPMNIPLGSKINSDLNAENEIPFGHHLFHSIVHLLIVFGKQLKFFCIDLTAGS